MITPTVGRVVWFYPYGDFRGIVNDWTKPLAAIISHVWDDRLVNLGVFDSNGNVVGQTSVMLLQDDEPKPEGMKFACWMPYQKGQAAKTEALESQIKGA